MSSRDPGFAARQVAPDKFRVWRTVFSMSAVFPVPMVTRARRSMAMSVNLSSWLGLSVRTVDARRG